jgi:hypothetical protein
MLGDTRDAIQKVTDRSRLFADELMDLGMWWWYPFPISPAGADDALQGTERAAGMELVPPSFLTLAQTKKPLWVGLQAYGKPDRKDGRFPTPLEYRAQAYLALIHGARGLMYYVGSGSGGNGILNKPEQGHWQDVKGLVRELRELEPVLLADDASEAIAVEPADAPISFRMKQSADGVRVLLAANRSEEPMEVTVESAAIGDGVVTVLFEHRTVRAIQDGLSDRFGPYEVHVYRMGR